MRAKRLIAVHISGGLLSLSSRATASGILLLVYVFKTHKPPTTSRELERVDERFVAATILREWASHEEFFGLPLVDLRLRGFETLHGVHLAGEDVVVLLHKLRLCSYARFAITHVNWQLGQRKYRLLVAFGYRGFEFVPESLHR